MFYNWLDYTPIKTPDKKRQRKPVRIKEKRLPKNIEIIKDYEADLHYKIKEV